MTRASGCRGVGRSSPGRERTPLSTCNRQYRVLTERTPGTPMVMETLLDCRWMLPHGKVDATPLRGPARAWHDREGRASDPRYSGLEMNGNVHHLSGSTVVCGWVNGESAVGGRRRTAFDGGRREGYAPAGLERGEWSPVLVSSLTGRGGGTHRAWMPELGDDSAGRAAMDAVVVVAEHASESSRDRPAAPFAVPPSARGRLPGDRHWAHTPPRLARNVVMTALPRIR